MGLLGSATDWQYRTLPNNVSCLASRGRNCRFSRGKCLGGSTSINYMLYTRGNRRDFNYNVTGWSYEDLQPYFLRYEALRGLERYPCSSVPYHNTTGIFKIEFFDDPNNPWHSRLFEGYETLGIPLNLDVNGEFQIGVTQVVGYVAGGERNSAARVYLAREDVQRNLTVAKNTLCTGVIFDDDNNARGVTLLPAAAAEQLRVFARKEVILSAGTIGTPQILMLSGIGPADHLNKMGIPVRVDLPVGDNMSDHVLPLLVLSVDRHVPVVKKALSALGQLGEYLVSRGGSLASGGLSDVNVFANTHCYDRKRGRLRGGCAECELPNVQIIHAYIHRLLVTLAKPIVQQAIDLDDATVEQLAEANAAGALIVVSPVLLTPHSRGSVRLASRDPKAHPAIFPNYLSDRRDVARVLRSIEVIEALVETPVFRRNNARLVRLRFPACEGWVGRDYWRCYARHMTYAVYHAVGTCALGRVVDGELRVRGVRRLRVADASVLPRVPRGNTAAAVLAVGERLVDFISRAPREVGSPTK